jgi:hypothetical protein
MWCEGMWWCVFCCVCGVNGARLAFGECDAVLCCVQYV